MGCSGSVSKVTTVENGVAAEWCEEYTFDNLEITLPNTSDMSHSESWHFSIIDEILCEVRPSPTTCHTRTSSSGRSLRPSSTSYTHTTSCDETSSEEDFDDPFSPKHTADASTDHFTRPAASDVPGRRSILSDSSRRGPSASLRASVQLPPLLRLRATAES